MIIFKYDKTRLGHGAENQQILTKELLKLLILPVTVILGIYALRTIEFMNPTFQSPKLEPDVVHYSFEKNDQSEVGVRY
jgi:hypothetical protein